MTLSVVNDNSLPLISLSKKGYYHVKWDTRIQSESWIHHSHCVTGAHLSTLLLVMGWFPSSEKPFTMQKERRLPKDPEAYPSSWSTATGTKDFPPLTSRYLFRAEIRMGNVPIPKPITWPRGPLAMCPQPMWWKDRAPGLTGWQNDSSPGGMRGGTSCSRKLNLADIWLLQSNVLKWPILFFSLK